jgi:DNA helicase II / ATP-dependent DNA helicase PcrA
MYVGTIHGFCLDLLQRYLFWYLKYDVLDDVKQRLLIDRNYRKSGMASLDLKRWRESSIYITLLRILREANADQTVLDSHPVHAALESYLDVMGTEYACAQSRVSGVNL